MKIFALILLGLPGFFVNAQMMVHNKPVTYGEELQFKLSYGWFAIGRGTFKISDENVVKDGKECIEINVFGKTSGLAGVFSKIRDKWGAIIDKNTFLPYYSYRDISEGDYDLNQKTYFDYDSMQARMESFSSSEENARPTEYYVIEKDNVFDMMGGIMYARSIDYKAINKGDIIRLHAFFDKKFYDFEMVYHGVEMIKTKMGKIYCYKIVPTMQNNSVFDGKNAITFWISADANRLPLRVQSDMNFGKAYCDLIAYKNVKSGIDFK